MHYKKKDRVGLPKRRSCSNPILAMQGTAVFCANPTQSIHLWGQRSLNSSVSGHHQGRYRRGGLSCMRDHEELQCHPTPLDPGFPEPLSEYATTVPQCHRVVGMPLSSPNVMANKQLGAHSGSTAGLRNVPGAPIGIKNLRATSKT